MKIRQCFARSSPETRRNGLCVIVDARRGAWRLARTCMRQVTTTLDDVTASLVMVRPDAFWDKQSLDNCARTHHKDGEVSKLPYKKPTFS